jgi:hypothetical protein
VQVLGRFLVAPEVLKLFPEVLGCLGHVEVAIFTEREGVAVMIVPIQTKRMVL